MTALGPGRWLPWSASSDRGAVTNQPGPHLPAGCLALVVSYMTMFAGLLIGTFFEGAGGGLTGRPGLIVLAVVIPPWFTWALFWGWKR